MICPYILDTPIHPPPFTNEEESKESQEGEVESDEEEEEKPFDRSLPADAPSILDRLPRELIFQIINNVPQSVHSLKLVSN